MVTISFRDLDYSFECDIVDPSVFDFDQVQAGAVAINLPPQVIAHGTGIGWFQQGKKDESEPIPENRLIAARDVALASHISRDGSTCYRFQMGRWKYAKWDGLQFGSYWPGDKPEDATCLK